MLTSLLSRQGAASSHRRAIAAGSCCVALLVAGANLEVGAARAQTYAGSFTVVVTITNSELKLAPSTVPTGSVVFKIVNKANIARDFEIGGKKTPIIVTGKAATLRAKITKFARYVSVGAGQAPLSGLLGALPACTNPKISTVDVQVISGVIALSQARVPCGTVTFVVTNKEPAGSRTIHTLDFAVPTDVKGGVITPRLRGGQTAHISVNVRFKGKVYYVCEEPEHSENGEQGFLVVG